MEAPAAVYPGLWSPSAEIAVAALGCLVLVIFAGLVLRKKIDRAPRVEPSTFGLVATCLLAFALPAFFATRGPRAILAIAERDAAHAALIIGGVGLLAFAAIAAFRSKATPSPAWLALAPLPLAVAVLIATLDLRHALHDLGASWDDLGRLSAARAIALALASAFEPVNFAGWVGVGVALIGVWRGLPGAKALALLLAGSSAMLALRLHAIGAATLEAVKSPHFSGLLGHEQKQEAAIALGTLVFSIGLGIFALRKSAPRSSRAPLIPLGVLFAVIVARDVAMARPLVGQRNRESLLLRPVHMAGVEHLPDGPIGPALVVDAAGNVKFIDLHAENPRLEAPPAGPLRLRASEVPTVAADSDIQFAKWVASVTPFLDQRRRIQLALVHRGESAAGLLTSLTARLASVPVLLDVPVESLGKTEPGEAATAAPVAVLLDKYRAGWVAAFELGAKQAPVWSSLGDSDPGEALPLLRRLASEPGGVRRTLVLAPRAEQRLGELIAVIELLLPDLPFDYQAGENVHLALALTQNRALIEQQFDEINPRKK